MSSFIERLKHNLTSRENSRGFDNTLVSSRDLAELINHFQSMDSALRVSATPMQSSNIVHSLVIATQSVFHNLGQQEAFDHFMFTIAQLRKTQIDNRRLQQKIGRAMRTKKTPVVMFDEIGKWDGTLPLISPEEPIVIDHANNREIDIDEGNRG